MRTIKTGEIFSFFYGQESLHESQQGSFAPCVALVDVDLEMTIAEYKEQKADLDLFDVIEFLIDEGKIKYVSAMIVHFSGYDNTDITMHSLELSNIN